MNGQSTALLYSVQLVTILHDLLATKILEPVFSVHPYHLSQELCTAVIAEVKAPESLKLSQVLFAI